MELKLMTDRLMIKPFTYDYLEEYYKEFTDEITKYQYPDSFHDIKEAKALVSEFVEEMENGNMLELVILTHDGEFIGSMEAFGMKEKAPEVGLWLKESSYLTVKNCLITQKMRRRTYGTKNDSLFVWGVTSKGN